MSAPVVDCSTTAAWILSDEQSPDADAALEVVRENGALVPALWSLEIRNVLLRAERRGRVVPDDADAALARLQTLRIQLDYASRHPELMRLARGHGLTAYDAAYLDLALRERRRLATLDRKLGSAAEAEGIEVIGR